MAVFNQQINGLTRGRPYQIMEMKVIDHSTFYCVTLQDEEKPLTVRWLGNNNQIAGVASRFFGSASDSSEIGAGT